MKKTYGSPYDRGGSDSYYRRAKSPHKMHHQEEGSIRITNLTPEEIAEYRKGYEDNEELMDHKEWE